jgi:arylsulfate sulfotransferase
MTIRRGRVYSALASGLLILLTTSCGTGSNTNHGTPETSITATQNPLVAQYGVWSFGAAQIWVEFGSDTTYGRQTSSMSTAGPSTHLSTIQVAGMKPSSTYHMRAHVDWSDGTSWVDQDQTFTTGALPSSNSVNTTVTRFPAAGAASAQQQQGVELMSLIAPVGSTAPIDVEAAVTDLDGNIIWYYDLDTTQGLIPFPIKPLANGHMLVNVFNELAGPEGNLGTIMREIDLAGNTIHELSSNTLSQELATMGLPVVTMHHDMLPLPNGHLILLCDASQNYTDLPGYPGTTAVIGDLLIDLDPDWKPVWTWSTFDHFDVNRHFLGLPDWTHSNAVVYTPNDGNLILSMRNQSWVVKIDYENGAGTGNVLWRLGYQGDFQLAGSDPSQWFYAQHFPNVLNITGSQITLGVFDNGNERVLDDSGTQCGVGNPIACYSRAAIFKIDEVAHTASLQWQYIPNQLFSPWGGNIDLVDNGNVEFAMSAPFTGLESQVMEVTQDANPSVVWQMDINGANAYRAYRIPSLYPGVQW